MNYYIMEINSCESKILDKIDIVKRYGIDTTIYEEELATIINDMDKKVSTSSPNGIAFKMQAETMYKLVLEDLRNLEKKLDGYQKYMNVYFRNNALSNDIDNNNEFRKNKIDFYVNEGIVLINETFKIDIDNVHEAKRIISNVYETLYKIIKLELLLEGNSHILNYIIDKNMGIEYLNDLVRDDINRLKSCNLYDSEIDNMVSNLSKKGLDYHYGDKDLILSITLKMDDMVEKVINDKIKMYDENIASCRESIDEDKANLNYINNNTYDYKAKKKKALVKTIISSVLVTLNILGYKFMPGLVKNKNTDTTYMTKREVYDTISDEVRSEEARVHKSEDEYVTLKVYGEVKESGKRITKEYNLSEIELDNIKDYIDEYDPEKRMYEESIKYRMGEQLSREEYIVVERMQYGDIYESFDEEQYQKDLHTILLIIYMFGGLCTTSMLTYLMIYLINKKKENKGLLMNKSLSDEINEKRALIDDLKNSKKELLNMQKKYEDSGVNKEEYKAKIYNRIK